jgi:hypothetical protein
MEKGENAHGKHHLNCKNTVWTPALITKDEMMVSYLTPVTRPKSFNSNGLRKGSWAQKRPRSMLAEPDRCCQHSDSKGLVYIHIVSSCASINTIYFFKVMGTFFKPLRMKMPEIVSLKWFFHWDLVLVHTAAIIQDWLTANSIQVLRHLPYSPDLASAFCFSM